MGGIAIDAYTWQITVEIVQSSRRHNSLNKSLLGACHLSLENCWNYSILISTLKVMIRRVDVTLFTFLLMIFRFVFVQTCTIKYL